jgi:peroxiredoxin
MIRKLILPLGLAALALAAGLPRQAPDLAIQMNGGKTIRLSDYKGKVVAVGFILTTCPHCQKTAGFLIKAQSDYGPRGFQVLLSAIQNSAEAAVPGFVQTFHTNFPVGFNDGMIAMNFMQHPMDKTPMMPMLSLIDKQGMIRAQYEGNDEKFFNDQQEQNLRTQIEALVNEGTAAKKLPRQQPAKK